MAHALSYMGVRTRVRDYVNDRRKLLHTFRLLRCALIQGPWQSLMVRWYQARSANPPLPVNATSVIGPIDAEAAAQRLDRDAFARGFQVPGALVDGAVAFAKSDGQKRIDDPHRRCFAVHALAHDPQIVEVARRFLGAEPILLETKIFWTIPKPDELGRVNMAAEDGLFHYDLADVKALTVFIYLTDVDEQSGPHVVIPGTQMRKNPLQILRRNMTDDEAERRFGDRIRMITGPRGTGWFEDITTYHKQAGGDKVRLMLTLMYTLHRKPVAKVA